MLPQAVESGIEALELLQEQSFAIAILDMQIPHMEGVTLAVKIHQYLPTKNLPLVLLTSIDKTEIEKQAATNTNFAAVISKPIKQIYLYNLLNQILSTKPVNLTVPTQPQKTSTPIVALPLQILLAEDNIVNQKVAIHLLQQIGYTADVAKDGLEVLEAVNARHYDVVLMDVQMPKMDGLEATRRIRESNKVQPRIIAMTANAMQSDREECLSAGMDDYLSKPIRLAALANALGKCQVKASAIALPSPIDAKVIQEFKNMVGENAEAILVEIIDCYLEDAPQHLETIASAISQNNKSELRQASHTLKSSSATLGATHLAAICQEMETLSRSLENIGDDSSHTEDGLGKLPQLQAEYEQVLVALHLLVSQHRKPL